MIGTGATAIAALDMIQEWTASLQKEYLSNGNRTQIKADVRMLAVAATRRGVHSIKEKHPNVRIWLASMDGDDVDANGMIRPGLGDAGDRMFNTLAHPK